MSDTTHMHDLVDAYHMMAHLGLDDLTYAHLSVRSMSEDAFYIGQFGYLFSEMHMDYLSRISLDEMHECNAVNPTGIHIHRPVYQARKDIGAVFHLHTPAQIAVSVLSEGFIPLSQWALHLYGRVGYHAYDSLVLDEARQSKNLVRDLGMYDVLFLRHHGTLICGRTIQEAFMLAHHLEKACQTQLQILSTQRAYITLSQPVIEQAVHDLLHFEKDFGRRDFEALRRLIKS